MSPIERQDPFSCYGQNGYGVGNFVIGNFLRGQEEKGAHAFGTNLYWPEPLPAARDLQPAMIGNSRNSTAQTLLLPVQISCHH